MRKNEQSTGWKMAKGPMILSCLIKTKFAKEKRLCIKNQKNIIIPIVKFSNL